MRCTTRDWRAHPMGVACAVAVLLGLLAMHGLPFGAAGCQAGSAMVASVSANVPANAPAGYMRAGDAPTGRALPPPTEQAEHAGQAGQMAGTASCVTVLPNRPAPPTLTLVAVLALLGAAGTAVGRGGGRGRSRADRPPQHGVDLLIRMCVSRT